MPRPDIVAFKPHSEISRLIASSLSGADVRVLEAGCGSLTRFEIPPSWHITGIDISPEQLDRNTRINAKILGNLETFSLQKDFDLCICWNVLEHLDDPAGAMRNMASSIRPGGLLVIGIPFLGGFKGLVTKCTPHWIHVLYYRLILKQETAGQPGHAPFPTFLRPEIDPRSISRRLQEMGFDERYHKLYASAAYADVMLNRKAVSLLFRALSAAIRLLSLGRIGNEYSDFVGIYQRKSLDA